MIAFGFATQLRQENVRTSRKISVKVLAAFDVGRSWMAARLVVKQIPLWEGRPKRV